MILLSAASVLDAPESSNGGSLMASFLAARRIGAVLELPSVASTDRDQRLRG
jgi:hypothetical protein